MYTLFITLHDDGSANKLTVQHTDKQGHTTPLLKGQARSGWAPEDLLLEGLVEVQAHAAAHAAMAEVEREQRRAQLAEMRDKPALGAFNNGQKGPRQP